MVLLHTLHITVDSVRGPVDSVRGPGDSDRGLPAVVSYPCTQRTSRVTPSEVRLTPSEVRVTPLEVCPWSLWTLRAGSS